MLLKCGVDRKLLNRLGRTALDVARYSRRQEMVDFLSLSDAEIENLIDRICVPENQLEDLDSDESKRWDSELERRRLQRI
jgi:hypothetical protein